MKSRNIHLSKSKIQGEQEMSVKQAEYLEYLMQTKFIENPFTSRKDMKNKLSKCEASKAIDFLLKNGQIKWIIPTLE
jgi:hypothetical protein